MGEDLRGGGGEGIIAQYFDHVSSVVDIVFWRSQEEE